MYHYYCFSDGHFHQSSVKDQLKSCNRLIVPTPIRTLVQLKYSSVGLVPHYFYDDGDKPPTVFRLNSSLPLFSHLIQAFKPAVVFPLNSSLLVLLFSDLIFKPTIVFPLNSSLLLFSHFIQACYCFPT